MEKIEGIKEKLLEDYFFTEMDEGGDMSGTPLLRHYRGLSDMSREVMLRFELNEIEAEDIIVQAYFDVVGIEEIGGIL